MRADRLSDAAVRLHPYTGREHAVPCMEIGCRRTTWRDDAFCVQHATFTDGGAFPRPALGEAGDPPAGSPASSQRKDTP